MTVLQIVRGARAAEIRGAWEPGPFDAGAEADGWTWTRRIFHTIESAEFELAGLARDSDAVSSLRGLLARHRADVFRLRDAQVVAAVAALLSQQRLVLHEGTRVVETLASGGGVAASEALAPRGAPITRSRAAPAPPPPAAPPPAAGRPSPPPAAAPQTDPELQGVAQDEQAATLIAAARDGVPFCEICEKARLAARATEPEAELA